MPQWSSSMLCLTVGATCRKRLNTYYERSNQRAGRKREVDQSVFFPLRIDFARSSSSCASASRAVLRKRRARFSRTYVGNLQASDGVHGMRGLLTLGLVLLIAVSLDGSALVSNSYWRKAILYARTGECQICMKNRKRSLGGKNPLTGGRAQRDLTRATSLHGSGQGRRSDFVTQHLKNAPDLIGKQVKEPC